MKKQKEYLTKQAVILSIHHKEIRVQAGKEVLTCVLPGAVMAQKNAAAVGDLAEIEERAPGVWRLKAVLPRRTALYRGKRGKPGTAVLAAANGTCLLTVMTGRMFLERIGYGERAVLEARRSGMKAGIYVTETGEAPSFRERAVFLEAAGARVFFEEPGGRTDRLFEALRGETVILSGEHGCGKTRLWRRLLGLKEEPEGQKKATTASILMEGPDETWIADTPGFGDFAQKEADSHELAWLFPEIWSEAEQCPFRDCTHTDEPGCMVAEAVRSGKVRRDRLEAFRSLKGGTAAPQKIDYRRNACGESFACKVCGAWITPEEAGTRHRNHCPSCLSSIHADREPGDRASLCRGIMDPIGVWVRKDGEWALIHRCRTCGALSSNRIAADDNPLLLMSIAVKPLSRPPFPLELLGKGNRTDDFVLP